MRAATIRPVRKLFLIVGVFWSTASGIGFGEDAKQIADTEKIGEVFGKLVCRADLGKDSKVQDKLHELFLAPVTVRYLERHANALQPTDIEVSLATEYFNKLTEENAAKEEPARRKRIAAIQQQLECRDLTPTARVALQRDKALLEEILELRKMGLGKEIVVLIVSNWKFQRHLYDNYGGGRVLWQQGGVEAFDATHKWLEEREKAGNFKFIDEKLRLKFYSYWTTQYHGPYLIEDSETIETEFLKPAWVGMALDKTTDKK